jgi:hypothetical protein
MSSTTFGSLYKLYSSLFHLGRQHPLSCVGPYIVRNIFLSNVFSICFDICVKVQVTLPSHSIGLINVWYSLHYAHTNQQCQNVLNDVSTRYVVGLYWVPGHAGVRGNEIADGLERGGAGLGFLGPEPALGVSRRDI